MAVWIGDGSNVGCMGEGWVFRDRQVVEQLAEVFFPAAYTVMFCCEDFASTVLEKEALLSWAGFSTAKEIDKLFLVVVESCCFQ